MVAKYKIVFISVLHHHKKDAVKDNYCIEKFAGAIYNLVKTFITTSDSNDVMILRDQKGNGTGHYQVLNSS